MITFLTWFGITYLVSIVLNSMLIIYAIVADRYWGYEELAQHILIALIALVPVLNTLMLLVNIWYWAIYFYEKKFKKGSK